MHQTGLFSGINKIIDMKVCLLLSRHKRNYYLLSPDKVPVAITHIILLS